MDEVRLRSRTDTSSDAFARNAEAQRALADELRTRLEKVRLGGSEKSRERHVSRGKLLPRDRVDALLDPGSPFLELSPLAAHGLYDGEAAAGGVLTVDTAPGAGTTLRGRFPASRGDQR